MFITFWQEKKMEGVNKRVNSKKRCNISIVSYGENSCIQDDIIVTASLSLYSSVIQIEMILPVGKLTINIILEKLTRILTKKIFRPVDTL